MRSTLMALLLFASVNAAAATIYKWVDANGVTHYSDQPHPGASKIEVDAAQTYSAPSSPITSAGASPNSADAGPPYKECELYRPGADEVFFSVEGVTAKLRLDPQLRPGDKAVIALDNKRLNDLPMIGNEFQVSPVYRGTHTLVAVVEDLSGKAVCQTPAVTFHVRQASILSPQSPQRKPPAKPSPKP
jgi:hypothetical protein